jgi:hypothetical protein
VGWRDGRIGAGDLAGQADRLPFQVEKLIVANLLPLEHNYYDVWSRTLTVKELSGHSSRPWV